MLLNPRAAEHHPSDRASAVEGVWLAGAVAVVLVIGYTVTAGLVAAVLATAGGSHFSATTVFVAGLVGWLCVHQVPLSIGGAMLTVLPLVPTILAVLLVAGVSSRVARLLRFYRPDQALAVVLAMALPHAAAGGCVAALFGNGIPVVDAFLCCGFTAAVGAVWGVASRCGLVLLVREAVPDEVSSGLRSGVLGCFAVLGSGVLITAAGTLSSLPRLQAAFDGLPAGDAFGEGLLSLLYVPNAVVAGWSFATGVGLSAGRFVLQPWQVVPGRMPDLPLFSVLPSSGPQWWWFAALALPLVASGLVGWSCRAVSGDPRLRMRAVVIASLVTSLGVLGVGAVSSGSVAAFGSIGVRPVVLAAATFCWTAVPAALVAWFFGPRESHPVSDLDGDLDGGFAREFIADPEEGDPDEDVDGDAGDDPDGEFTGGDLDGDLGEDPDDDDVDGPDDDRDDDRDYDRNEIRDDEPQIG